MIIQEVGKVCILAGMFAAVFFFGFYLWQVFVILAIADLAEIIPFKNYVKETSYVEQALQRVKDVHVKERARRGIN